MNEALNSTRTSALHNLSWLLVATATEHRVFNQSLIKIPVEKAVFQTTSQHQFAKLSVITKPLARNWLSFNPALSN